MDDRDDPMLRVPPHSDEAEQAVLGAILFDNAALDEVSALLTPAHFYRPDYRGIYATISALVLASQPADVITVHDAGGHALRELSALAQACYTRKNARHYAGIMAERWREREMMRIGAELMDKASRGARDGDAGGLIDSTVTALLGLNAGVGAKEPQRVDQLAADFVAHIQEVYEGKVVTIPTLLRDLDRITAEGIRDGELWVIGARPSMGKTSLTNTLARNMSTQARASLFLSQEDSLRALVARNVAALGSINLADLRNPKRAPASMWDGLSEGVDRLMGLNMYLDDEPGLTVADVRRKIQQVRRRADVGVVVVDYLQLMTGEGDNRNVELGKIANGLKRTAKELGTGIILLSQMNREADKRGGPPMVSDLRDSGDIEGAADLIGLLWRPGVYWPREDNKRYAELIIAKQKNGPTGAVDLYFDGAFQRFADWDGPPPNWKDAKRGGGTARTTAGGMD